jgi:hypothetical protein
MDALVEKSHQIEKFEAVGGGIKIMEGAVIAILSH